MANTASAKIPTTVITGFLGAGKTTLVRHLLGHAQGKRIALIINEFGELGVDKDILAGCGDETCREEDMIELSNGCICCTVADEFSREHVATLGVTWEITDRWKVAARYKYLSGRPEDAYLIHEDVLGAGQPLRYSRETTARGVGRKPGYGVLDARVDYRRAFGPIDVTAFLDVINVTSASSSDDTEFDYRRGVEVKDDSEAEPLIGLRFDYAW